MLVKSLSFVGVLQLHRGGSPSLSKIPHRRANSFVQYKTALAPPRRVLTQCQELLELHHKLTEAWKSSPRLRNPPTESNREPAAAQQRAVELYHGPMAARHQSAERRGRPVTAGWASGVTIAWCAAVVEVLANRAELSVDPEAA